MKYPNEDGSCYPHPAPPKRRRSRRLRKKLLRIEEFTELGFGYEVAWSPKLSTEEQDRFIDQLIGELVQPRGLSLGGGLGSGFVMTRRWSASEEARLAFGAWFRRLPGAQAVEAGELRDAWYDDGRKANGHG